MIKGYIFALNEHVERKIPSSVGITEYFTIVFVFMMSKDPVRLRNLEACIRYYRKKYVNAEIILAEQFKDEPKAKNIHGVLKIDHEDHGLFSKSRLMNLATAIASNQKIFFCDADIVVDTFVLDNCLAALDLYDFAKPFRRKLIDVKVDLTSDDIFTTPYIKIRNRTDSPLGGGAFCFNKDFYFKIGGMDEFFLGYGSEDHAFGFKVINSGKCCSFDGDALHLYHEPAVKVLENYKNITDDNNDYYFHLSNYDREKFDRYIEGQRAYFKNQYLKTL